MGGLYTPTRFPPQIPKAKREAMPKFPDKRVEQFPIESWNDPVARSKK